MNPKRILILGIAASISACVFGGNAALLPVANRPGGATAMLETSSTKLSGELIAVQNDGVVVAGKTIVFAPFVALKKFSLDDMSGDYSLGRMELPNAEKLARLRLVSHFPQGLTPAIRKALLERAAQPDIMVLQ